MEQLDTADVYQDIRHLCVTARLIHAYQAHVKTEEVARQDLEGDTVALVLPVLVAQTVKIKKRNVVAFEILLMEL
jgi:hypothetical protein